MSEPASRERILDFLERNASKDLLRFSAVGSVDDSRRLSLIHETERALLWDLNDRPLTGFASGRTAS